MDKKRTLERSESPLEADESMHEERRANLCETPIHPQFIEDPIFPDSAGSCSSRKKPKMDIEYLPRFSAGVLLPPPPSASSSDASNSSSSSSNNSSGDSSANDNSDFLMAQESPVYNTIVYSDAANGTDVATTTRTTATMFDNQLQASRPGVLREINHDGQATETLMQCSPTHYYCQFRNLFTPVELSHPPIPNPMKNLADAEDIWKSMLKKEAIYTRSSSYMTKHRDLQCRMRSLLIDWMMEVCEEYKLRRTTLYLACEFFDRYMANTSDVIKTRLQLIGITALFIASKMEEIYPPRLSVFVDLTDGACFEKDVVAQELLMLHNLNWMLSPVTPIMWLQLYIQLSYASINERSITLNSTMARVVHPSPKELIVKIAQLLDMCLLDLEYLDFRPSVLAATALYHCTNPEIVTRVSGYTTTDLLLCIKWMKPFAVSYRESLQRRQMVIREPGEGEQYTVQTHSANLQSLDQALECRERISRLEKGASTASKQP